MAVVLTVPTMACRHDVRAISAAITDLRGITALKVDLPSRTVTVEGEASPAAIGAAIVAVGYEVTNVPQ